MPNQGHNKFTSFRHRPGIGTISWQYCTDWTVARLSAGRHICVCFFSDGCRISLLYINRCIQIIAHQSYAWTKWIVFDRSQNFFTPPSLCTASSPHIHRGDRFLCSGLRICKCYNTIFMSSKTHKSNTQDLGYREGSRTTITSMLEGYLLRKPIRGEVDIVFALNRLSAPLFFFQHDQACVVFCLFYRRRSRGALVEAILAINKMTVPLSFK